MEHLVRQSNKLMQNISTIDVYILTSPSVLFSTVRFLPAWWISGLSLDIVHRSIFCDIQLVVGVQKDPFQFMKIITCCARSYAEIMSVNSFQTVGDSLFFLQSTQHIFKERLIETQPSVLSITMVLNTLQTYCSKQDTQIFQVVSNMYFRREMEAFRASVKLHVWFINTQDCCVESCFRLDILLNAAYNIID